MRSAGENCFVIALHLETSTLLHMFTLRGFLARILQNATRCIIVFFLPHNLFSGILDNREGLNHTASVSPESYWSLPGLVFTAYVCIKLARTSRLSFRCVGRQILTSVGLSQGGCVQIRACLSPKANMSRNVQPPVTIFLAKNRGGNPVKEEFRQSESFSSLHHCTDPIGVSLQHSLIIYVQV